MTSSGDHPSWVRAVRFVHGVQFLGDFVTAINTADPRHAGVLMTLEDGHTAPHLRIEVPPTPRHLEPQVRCVPWPMIAEYTPAKVSDDAELMSRLKPVTENKEQSEQGISFPEEGILVTPGVLGMRPEDVVTLDLKTMTVVDPPAAVTPPKTRKKRRPPEEPV